MTRSLRKSTVFDCSILDLDKAHTLKGNLTVVENLKNIPFEIKRVYYLYDVPGGSERGGHAHIELQQYLIAASGSFDVKLSDGTNTRTVCLNRPYYALHIVPGIWRELQNFSSGSICLVLASHPYDETDYVRSFDEFIVAKERNNDHMRCR
ncbi:MULTISPECIES: FdtA/QdtA family cupin domain-containing protein [Roseivirga]|uniref:dTDP-6-deoxy-3,4-keto-hexulose isomerase n=1 Tax=Roseivirga thermotolerans TaxID=1758176 RepID=A0ABQ3I7E7_9BACT|nr:MULTISPECIES: FdtA/QdtA family cupin domain-containing protein [Roseivirga]GHE68573.1 dTDP-6-deoxy-3,4-keto-hexulose isomerase [Roseivirga thermotolerans]|tara:strand:+ start:2082 stop:2534 length:453 start_codon:yes stop_codon:yes gene_type:complete